MVKKINRNLIIGVIVLALLVIIFGYYFRPLAVISPSESCYPASCPSGYTDRGIECELFGLNYACARDCYRPASCGSFGSWQTSSKTYSITASSKNTNYLGNIVYQTSDKCYKYKGESSISVSNWDAGGILYSEAQSISLYSFFGSSAYARNSCSGGKNSVSVQSGEYDIGKGVNGNGIGSVALFKPYLSSGCSGSEAYGVEGTLTVNTLYSTAPYTTEDRQIKTCTGTVQCTSKSNCGTDGLTGSKYCKGNDIYQKYKTYSCSNYKCSSSDSEQYVQNCPYGCLNGACQAQVFECNFGGEKCVGQDYYSCQNNFWFNQGQVINKCGYTPSECTIGQDKCIGTDYYTCSNNIFISQGKILGKCGYTSTDTSGYNLVNNQCVYVTQNSKYKTLTECQDNVIVGQKGYIVENNICKYVDQNAKFNTLSECEASLVIIDDDELNLELILAVLAILLIVISLVVLFLVRRKK